MQYNPWSIFSQQGAAEANTAINNAVNDAANNMSDDDKRWHQIYQMLNMKDFEAGNQGGLLGITRNALTKPVKDIENIRLANVINDYIKNTDEGKAQWAKLTGQEQKQETPTTTDTDTTVKEEVKDTATTTPAANKVNTATTADTVEYTYKPGDTFGQVIKNLGLESGSGLWGDNGDVAYYTQQLAEQGAMNSLGNIPVGTTIRLTRRPVDPALQEYYKKYGYKG